LVTISSHFEDFLLFPLVVASEVSLHVLDGFVVELALDLSGLQVVVVVDHEGIETLDSASQVIKRYVAVLVKVKTKPLVLNHDGDILVVMSDVIGHFVLVFPQHLDEKGNIVGGLVVDDIELIP
jgi:hypothetical protein